MRIKCLIFDCDGLMFNTEHYARESWKEVAQKHNMILPEWFFSTITGAGSTVFEELKKTVPEIMALLPEVKENLLPCIERAVHDKGNINKQGLIELLQYLHESRQYKVCIASSSKTSYVNWLVSTIGLNFPFNIIIGGDTVTKAKPDPDIFLKAAELAQVQPEYCLVLEDSKNGHLAAKRAGMHRMFIKDLIEPDEEFKALIEYEKKDLSEVIDFLKSL